MAIFFIFCTFERALECTWSHVSMCSGYCTRVNFCIVFKNLVIFACVVSSGLGILKICWKCHRSW